MKKIINRKVFDTKTAEFLVSTRVHNDTRWTEYYKTPNGRIFSVYYSQWQGESWGAIHCCDVDKECDCEPIEDTLERLLSPEKFEELFPGQLSDG